MRICLRLRKISSVLKQSMDERGFYLMRVVSIHLFGYYDFLGFLWCCISGCGFVRLRFHLFLAALLSAHHQVNRQSCGFGSLALQTDMDPQPYSPFCVCAMTLRTPFAREGNKSCPWKSVAKSASEVEENQRTVDDAAQSVLNLRRGRKLLIFTIFYHFHQYKRYWIMLYAKEVR